MKGMKMNSLSKYEVVKDLNRVLVQMIIRRSMSEYALQLLEDRKVSTKEIASKTTDEILEELGL